MKRKRFSSSKNVISFQLLCVEPGARVSSLSELKTVPVIAKFDIDQVLEKKIKPSFIPPVRI